MRDSFVLYTKIRETIGRLTDEQKGILFQAILDYETSNEVEIHDPIVDIAFIPIRQDLDVNNKKWEEIREARSEAGKKSAEARKRKTNPTSVDFVQTSINKDEQAGTNPTVYVNVNENVKVNENVNEKEKRTRFTPPAVEEVREYCEERNNGIDPEAFVDFYSSKGWKVGNQTMKDWKACVRTWERRHDNKASPKIEKFDMDAYLLKEMGVDTG